MADNVVALANTGTGTDVFATDDIAGVNYPRTKITLGADGVNAGDVSASNPMPVTATALDSINTKMPSPGQTTMAASQPVVIASNQSAVPVTLPNQTASTYNVAGVIVINTDLLVIDCTGFGAVSIQCTSMGTTGVVTPAWSNDNVNFVAATIMTQAGVTATTFNAAGLWTTPVLGRYLRLRLTTATTAGTTTLAVQGIASPINSPVPAQPISGTVTANIGTGALAAGTNAIGDVGIQYRASVTGGASVVAVMSPLTPAAATIKATAGRLVGWYLQNSAAALRSVKVFNIAAPTLGTSTATFEIDLPTNATVYVEFPGGIAFSTAMTYSVTSAKGLTDNTSTGLAANDVSGFFAFA